MVSGARRQKVQCLAEPEGVATPESDPRLLYHFFPSCLLPDFSPVVGCRGRGGGGEGGILSPVGGYSTPSPPPFLIEFLGKFADIG
jgi:hypothetical protein